MRWFPKFGQSAKPAANENENGGGCEGRSDASHDPYPDIRDHPSTTSRSIAVSGHLHSLLVVKLMAALSNFMTVAAETLR